MTPEERSAFRAFVREHHPDRGGDPEVFAAGLARFGVGEPAPLPETDSTSGPVGLSALPFPVRVGVALIRTWHHHRRTSRAEPPADHP